MENCVPATKQVQSVSKNNNPAKTKLRREGWGIRAE